MPHAPLPGHPAPATAERHPLAYILTKPNETAEANKSQDTGTVQGPTPCFDARVSRRALVFRSVIILT